MNYFMLSFLAQCLFTEFCFDRLPQMAAIKKLFKFDLFLVSLGHVYFVFVLTLNNHKARNRYPEMVMARTSFLSTAFSPFLSPHNLL